VADAEITIGASIEGLTASVESAKEAVSSLAEVVGVGFSINAIKDLVKDMADLAEQTQRSADILGVSTTQVQQLGLIAQMSGGSTEQMVTSMQRMEVSLQRALVPTSSQAAALHAMGLSAQELLKLPLPQQLDQFSDAFKRLRDQGINPTPLALMVMGRGAAGIVPMLEEGGSAVEKLKQHFIDVGAVMTTGTIKSLDTLEKSLTLSKASLTTMAGTLVSLASDALVRFSDGVAASAGTITKLAVSGSLGTYTFEYLKAILEAVLIRVEQLGVAFANLASGQVSQLSSDWEKYNAKLLTLWAEEGPKLDEIIKKAGAAYSAMTGDGGAALKSPNVDLGAGARAKSALDEANSQIKLADLVYKHDSDVINADAKLFVVTEQQKTSALIAAVNKREDTELAALNAAQVAAGAGTEEFKKAEEQKTIIMQKAVNDRGKIIESGLEEEERQWKAGADAISQAFNSQLRGLLAGTTSWGQAMKNVFADFITDAIEKLAKLALEFAAREAFMTLTHQAAVTTQTAASVQGAETAGAAEVLAALKSIAAAAGKVYANVFAYLSPAIGPFAAIPAAAAGAVTLATGAAFVGKYETGTDYVPQTGLALVHQGEAIIPASQNTGGGGGGGTTQFHFNGPIIGTQAWINQMMPQILRAMQRSQAVNPSLL
jgi:hypothetical protein